MSKIFLKYALFILCLLPFSAHALEGWYGSLGVGAVISDTSKITLDSEDLKIKNKLGLAGQLAMGYGFENPIRIEAELGLVYQNARDFLDHDTSIPYRDSLDGHLTKTLGMINTYFQFNKESNLNPYIGVGIGMAHCNLKLEYDVLAGTPPTLYGTQFTSKNWTQAYQGILGCEYSISIYSAVALEYRFLKLGKFTVKTVDVRATGNSSNHLLLLTLTQSF